LGYLELGKQKGTDLRLAEILLAAVQGTEHSRESTRRLLLGCMVSLFTCKSEAPAQEL
jgi:hypothetical protein